MRRNIFWLLAALFLLVFSSQTMAAPAISVLGKDYIFPNKIEGMPAKLSDFKGLEINSFKTSDGAKLTYWEAGSGKPLIFIPGWSANGAEYINVMYLLREHYQSMRLLLGSPIPCWNALWRWILRISKTRRVLLVSLSRVT